MIIFYSFLVIPMLMSIITILYTIYYTLIRILLCYEIQFNIFLFLECIDFTTTIFLFKSRSLAVSNERK